MRVFFACDCACVRAPRARLLQPCAVCSALRGARRNAEESVSTMYANVRHSASDPCMMAWDMAVTSESVR